MPQTEIGGGREKARGGRGVEREKVGVFQSLCYMKTCSERCLILYSVHFLYVHISKDHKYILQFLAQYMSCTKYKCLYGLVHIYCSEIESQFSIQYN